MEYILNKTPIRTTNNFKIDLDIKETPFDDYSIEGIDKVKKEIRNNLDTKIGLPINKYLYLKLDVTSFDTPVVINYDFNNKYLSSYIDIEVKEDVKRDINIVYTSSKEVFLNTKISINQKKNSFSNINIINLTNKESKSFISIENNLKDNASSKVNFIELGGKVKVSNYYSMLNGVNSVNEFYSLYLGRDNDKIDLNYYIGHNNKNTTGKILTVGSLSNNSYKTFKGTIDFYEGSSLSNGEENEKCTLLSDEVTSKSLPMLLCHEENVIGSHGVSTGKIDSDKLFYLTSRGISEKDAKKLIVISDYNKVIERITDEKLREKIENRINELL